MTKKTPEDFAAAIWDSLSLEGLDYPELRRHAINGFSGAIDMYRHDVDFWHKVADERAAEIVRLREQAIAQQTAAHPFNREKWHYSAEEVGLLPCPHCGPGQSVVELHQDDIGYWQVGCGRCGAHSGTLPDNEHFPDARERIIASWNKRT